jgi:transposase InsO family protein
VSVDPFIEAEEAAGRSVNNACRLLEVSRAAYYQRRQDVPSAREIADVELTERITAIHTEAKGTYGSPRVHRELAKRGVECGKRRVRRLMRNAGLEGRCKKRWRKTTIADPAAGAALDLIQRAFGPGAEIDRRYVGDITYIPTWEGWAYLATVIDLSSRRVVGWALASHMRTELVSDALKMALRSRGPEEGLIFHSDRGCQYTSADYGELARLNGVVLSIGRKGECWDNAVAESFFATIKRELIDTRTWPTREGLRRAVFDYIEGWYNVRRLHSSLDYCSPAEWEAVHRNTARQAA